MDSSENNTITPHDEKDYPVARRGGFGFLWLVLLAGAIWFFFFRVDYSKPWIKEEDVENALVVWCKDGNCDNFEHRYNLDVLNEGKAAYVDNKYIFEIYMENGGAIEVGVFCEKASDEMIYDRYCKGYDDDGELWLIGHLR